MTGMIVFKADAPDTGRSMSSIGQGRGLVIRWMILYIVKKVT